MKSTYLLV